MTVSCFINQVKDYHTNLAELFVTQERSFHVCSIAGNSESCAVVVLMFSKYTTLIKQPRFGNLSKSLPIVHIKILSTDSDLAPKL